MDYILTIIVFIIMHVQCDRPIAVDKPSYVVNGIIKHKKTNINLFYIYESTSGMICIR